MAITSSYPIAVPTITDTLVGTKFIEKKEPTTNSFNIGDIIQLASDTIGSNPVSIGTANGLSLSGQVLSLGLSSSSTNGALSSANWTTFNNKQDALNGVGFIKASGSTISYDNSTYTPTSRTLTINGTTYDLSANRSWTISGSGLTLTTIGTSGAATLVGDTLNIPQYTGGGGGTGSLEFNSTDLTVWNNGKGNISGNTSFGEKALVSNTTGNANTSYGFYALNANTTGFNNTAIGNDTLVSLIGGSYNVAIGSQALQASTSGTNNTAIGIAALASIVAGSYNVAIGDGAGSKPNAGSTGNVYIGSNAGPDTSVTENNKLYISNSEGTPLIGGDFAANTVTINGSITSVQFKLSALNTAPASATATGTLGEIRYDANYMYVCVATNTWKRSALTTW